MKTFQFDYYREGFHIEQDGTLTPPFLSERITAIDGHEARKLASFTQHPYDILPVCPCGKVDKSGHSFCSERCYNKYYEEAASWR